MRIGRGDGKAIKFGRICLIVRINEMMNDCSDNNDTVKQLELDHAEGPQHIRKQRTICEALIDFCLKVHTCNNELCVMRQRPPS